MFDITAVAAAVFFFGGGIANFYLAKAVVVVASWVFFELGVMVEQQDKIVVEPGWKFGWLVG